jgi:hypothetical protein
LLEQIEQLGPPRYSRDALGELLHLLQPALRCHAKHGPHLYISYRGEGGKTSATRLCGCASCPS